MFRMNFQIELVTLQQKIIGVFLVLQFGGERDIERIAHFPVKLGGAPVAHAAHRSGERAPQRQSAGVVHDEALAHGGGGVGENGGKIQPVSGKLTPEGQP